MLQIYGKKECYDIKNPANFRIANVYGVDTFCQLLIFNDLRIAI